MALSSTWFHARSVAHGLCQTQSCGVELHTTVKLWQPDIPLHSWDFSKGLLSPAPSGHPIMLARLLKFLIFHFKLSLLTLPLQGLIVASFDWEAHSPNKIHFEV